MRILINLFFARTNDIRKALIMKKREQGPYRVIFIMVMGKALKMNHSQCTL